MARGLLLACGVASGWAYAHADTQPLTVTVQPLGEVQQAATRSVSGSLLSLNDSTIGAELNAKVVKVLVDAGDYVSASQTLAELDCRDAQFALEQAKAGLEASTARYHLANTQLQRNQDLKRTGVIPAEVLDKATADFNAAQADIAVQKVQVASAELAVSRCAIKAPFAGQITKRHLQVGQHATVGAPAFQLLQSAVQEVVAHLSAEELADQTQGSALRFEAVEASIPLERRAVIGQVAGNTRTQEVRYALKGKHNLPVGANGRVVWQGKQPLLPANWLVQREGGLGVMLAVDGVAKFHPLPEAKEGQPVRVGLPPNTLLIDQNRLRARDGQAIVVGK